MSNPNKRTLIVTLMVWPVMTRLDFILECDPNVQVVKGEVFEITAPGCRTVRTKVRKVTPRTDGYTAVELRGLLRFHNLDTVRQRLLVMARKAGNVKNLQVCTPS